MSYLANVKLGVSPATSELTLYEYDNSGQIQKDRRIMTWETMRAVVEFMLTNKMSVVEVWLQGEKYDLTLSDKKDGQPGRGAN